MIKKKQAKSSKELTQDMSNKILKGLERGLLAVERDAKLNVGVDTGRLRRSITHDVKDNGNKIMGRVGSNVEYAFFHSLQNPYLENALYSNLDYIKRSIKSEVDK